VYYIGVRFISQYARSKKQAVNHRLSNSAKEIISIIKPGFVFFFAGGGGCACAGFGGVSVFSQAQQNDASSLFAATHRVQ